MCGMGCLEREGFKATPQRVDINFLQLENTMSENVGG